MSRSIRVLCVMSMCFLLVLSSEAQRKKRIAIMDFDYATVQTEVAAVFGKTEFGRMMQWLGVLNA